MASHRTIRGNIRYTSRQPGREGAERGRESYTLCMHADGRRVLTAHCEIDDPPPVVRDVVLTLGPEFEPLDAFVRISVDGKAEGSSFFLFEDRFAECQGRTRARGRLSQRIEYEQRTPVFGTHPIQGDAWLLGALHGAESPGVRSLDRFLMSSLDHRGATGPSLEWFPAGFPLEFIGRESVTVTAGRFDTLHFCFGDRFSTSPGSNESGEHPPYDLWVTDDGDFILVKAQVTGYMMTHYELTSLERLHG